MMAMDVSRYLKRIQYVGDIVPTYDALRRLQKSHLLTVPFENIDIHNKVPINLNIDSLFDKIVKNKKGGFCYELNGLFCVLLKKIGFNAHLISARVYSKDKGFGPAFDHATICVTIDEIKYLVDVGFGEFSFEPLRMDFEGVQQDERGRFCIALKEDGSYHVSKAEYGKKLTQYSFEENPFELVDFTEMCHYHQTSPDSKFTQRKLITIPILNGRYTLTSDKFIHKIANRMKIDSIDTIADYHEKLESIFGYYEDGVLIQKRTD